jgi:MerR family transcriptional regulator, light-induced transcriptional regulator
MDTTSTDSLPRHPIAVAARRTGLSPHVIRVWERRYAAVVPSRTAGGVRLYSDADVRRLLLLRRATEAGRSIGQVVHLSDGALLAVVRDDQGNGRPAAAPATETPAHGRVVDACVSAVEGLDAGALYDALSRAVVTTTPLEFVHGVAVPLLSRVGDLWASGQWTAAHEHVVSVHVRRVLGRLLDALVPEAGAPVLVATTPAGHRHEFGAMLVAIVAAALGWRVVYLGADLPARDTAAAARVTGAAAVALSAVAPTEPDELAVYLTALREGLPAGVPMLVGGSGAALFEEVVRASGGLPVQDLDTLGSTLATLAPAG